MLTRSYRLGRALPRSLFVAAVAAFTLSSPAAVPAQESLPPARTVVDRHVAAIGGRKAVLAHTSMRVVGTVSFPANGISGSLEAFAAKPNKAVVKMNIAGIGEAVEGFDGTVAWSMNPMTGPMLAQGKELDQKKFDADFYGELRGADRYKSMTTVENAAWQGRPSYKIRLVRHDGTEEFEYYDVENGFRTGREFTRDMAMGTLKIVQLNADYKKFGDLHHPVTTKVTVMGVEQVLTVTSIEYDNVNPAVFELPAAIKALLKPPAGR